jgi:glycosyltransferase involved in cell wall biosynthesis
MRSIKPDIVQTWNVQMDVLGGLAASLTGTPWLLREPADAMAWPVGVKTRLRQWIGATAGMVVSNSSGGDAYWAGRRPPDRRCIVANALPFDLIASAPPEHLMESPSGDPIIMYAGRLTEQKNPHVLIRALAQAVANTPALALIFGDGPLRPSLEHLVSELGVGDRILIRGNIPTIWGALKSSHLFISISHFEGRPNTVLEAMACGCPMIVSDIPAHREILDDESALFIRRYDNPDFVAQAIIEGLRDRAGAFRRSQAAYKRIGEWSIPAVGNAYENVYAKLLGQQKDASS